MENIFNQYPDIVSYFAIPTILGIILMMIPLLLSNVLLISHKYKSQHIIRMFFKEPVTICFFAFSSLGFVALIAWIFQIPRCCDFGCLNIFIENSAFVIIITLSFIMIIMTIAVIVLLVMYLDPKYLFKRICERHTKTLNKSARMLYKQNNSLETMQEMIFFSIKSELPYIYNEFMTYYHEKCIGKDNDKILENDYDTIEKIVYAICKTQKDKFVDFEINTWFRILLKNRNDDNAKKSIWKCIRCCIVYGNERFLKNYLDEANDIAENNEDENFRMFNCMVGAMLLYSKKYTMVKKLLEDGKLTAMSNSDVVSMYNKISKIDKKDLSKDYSYPEINQEGNMIDVIADDCGNLNVEWNNKFFALLFIKHCETENTKVPSIENDSPLINLHNNVVDYMNNKELLKKLGINTII